MTAPTERATSRRLFLQFLAASPLFAGSGRALADGLEAPNRLPDPMVWAPATLQPPIASPADAITVFDFEPVARQNVPPAHFGYMASGIDDEVTLRANRADFLKYQLRPRRLRDVSKVDMRIELFGATWGSPVVIAPTGGNRAHHPDGELAVSKAAHKGNHLQVLSTSASTSIDDAIKARGGTPIWFQLYASPSWESPDATRRPSRACAAPTRATAPAATTTPACKPPCGPSRTTTVSTSQPPA